MANRSESPIDGESDATRRDAANDPDGINTLKKAGQNRSKAVRLSFIAESVLKNGFVTVDDLAEQLSVSRMTIHRDLDELQGLSTLRKVRGGASAHRSTQFESDFQFRVATQLPQKRAIARIAAELAGEGDVVIIDDSSTAREVFPFLVDKTPLTIITNFLPVMEEAVSIPSVKLIALAGEYDARYHSFLGILCENTLANLYADVLFTSSSAVQGTEVFHQDQRIVTAKQAMMRASRTRVLMLDHSKFNHGALHRIGNVGEFTHIVVDAGLDDESLRKLQDTGSTVLIADL